MTAISASGSSTCASNPAETSTSCGSKARTAGSTSSSKAREVLRVARSGGERDVERGGVARARARRSRVERPLVERDEEARSRRPGRSPPCRSRGGRPSRRSRPARRRARPARGAPRRRRCRRCRSPSRGRAARGGPAVGRARSRRSRRPRSRIPRRAGGLARRRPASVSPSSHVSSWSDVDRLDVAPRRGRARSARGSPGAPWRAPRSASSSAREALRALRVAMVARRMEVRQRRMRDQLDAASSRRPASRPSPSASRGAAPARQSGSTVGQRRERRRRVERRDVPVEAQRIGLGREASGREQRLEAPVLGRGASAARLRADATRAGDLVRRVAAQRDEVGHLLGIDAVALAHLGRPDARELADPAHRLQDRDVVRGELEGVAIRGRDERRPAAPLARTRRPRRGSRRPRSRVPSRTRSPRPRARPGARSSCSRSSASNSRPVW